MYLPSFMRPRGALYLCMALSVPMQAAALTFEEALITAEQLSPGLQAQALSTRASREDSLAAGKLPDPRLVLGVQNLPVQGDDRGQLNADGMTMQMVGLMQEVPNRSRRAAEVAMAEAVTERSEAEFRLKRQEVRLAAAEAWLQVYKLEQQLKQFEPLYEQNKVLDATIDARIRAGQGVLADKPVAALERLMLDDRREQLLSELAQARAELRSWLGDEAAQPTDGPWPEWSIDPDRYRALLADQPELAMYRPLGRERQVSVALAAADKRPDWSWELAYQRRAAGLDDMVSVQVSVGLPVFPGSRQNRRLAAREMELSGLEYEREVMHRQLISELESSLAEHNRSARSLERIRQSQLPLAAERAELAFADYRGGRGTLDALVAARTQHIEARLDEIERTTALAISSARLQLRFGEQP